MLIFSKTRRFSSKNRGSSSVFLVIILSVMITTTLFFISMTKKITKTAYVDSVASLAGRSILSEYVPELKDSYGLFGFIGLSPEIDLKLKKYMNYSFSKKNGIRLGEVKSNVTEFSYRNLAVVAKEIKECMVFKLSKSLMSKKNVQNHKKGKRVLRNKMVLANLPSRNKKDFSIKGVGIMDSLIVDQYIMMTFNDALFIREKRETFFQNELEYIVCGHKSDKKNYNRIGLRIIILRNISNLAYIFSNQTMMTQVEAYCQLISPGPVGKATQMFVIEAWAFAESKNDLEILRHRGKVPLLKRQDTWMTDLKAVMKSKKLSKEGYIPNNSTTGQTYQDYIRIFLTIQGRKEKFCRMLDLMQINIQESFDRGFLINMTNSGFRYACIVSGKKYRYEENY